MKTGCREKASQTGEGEEGKGGWVEGEGGRYVVISNERLTKAWELDSGGVTRVRTAASSVKILFFRCRCCEKTEAKTLCTV